MPIPKLVVQGSSLVKWRGLSQASPDQQLFEPDAERSPFVIRHEARSHACHGAKAFEARTKEHFTVTEANADQPTDQ